MDNHVFPSQLSRNCFQISVNNNLLSQLVTKIEERATPQALNTSNVNHNESSNLVNLDREESETGFTSLTCPDKFSRCSPLKTPRNITKSQHRYSVDDLYSVFVQPSLKQMSNNKFINQVDTQSTTDIQTVNSPIRHFSEPTCKPLLTCIAEASTIHPSNACTDSSHLLYTNSDYLPSTNDLETSSSMDVVDLMLKQKLPTLASLVSNASGGVFTDSNLRNLVFKTAASNSSHSHSSSSEDNATTGSQLYLLVPSNCPVLLPRTNPMQTTSPEQNIQTPSAMYNDSSPQTTSVCLNGRPPLTKLAGSSPPISPLTKSTNDQQQLLQNRSEAVHQNTFSQVSGWRSRSIGGDLYLTQHEQIATRVNPLRDSEAHTTQRFSFDNEESRQTTSPKPVISPSGNDAHNPTISTSNRIEMHNRQSSAPGMLYINPNNAGDCLHNQTSLVTDDPGKSSQQLSSEKAVFLLNELKSSSSNLVYESQSETNNMLDNSNNHNNNNGCKSVFISSDVISPNRSFMDHRVSESKDIRRRVSHNEVERRRRDRINNLISELHKLLPPEQQAKSQCQSKGVVLKRVCEYFQLLDRKLAHAKFETKQARDTASNLELEVQRLRRENQILKAGLTVHISSELPSSMMQNAANDQSVFANQTEERASVQGIKRIFLNNNSKMHEGNINTPSENQSPPCKRTSFYQKTINNDHRACL